MGFNPEYLLTSSQLTAYVNQYVQNLGRRPGWDDKDGLMNMPCIKRYEEQLKLIHHAVASTFATYMETTYLARSVTPMKQLFNGHNHYLTRYSEFKENLDKQDEQISCFCRQVFVEFYKMSEKEIVSNVREEVRARVNHQLVNLITNIQGEFESNSSPLFRTHIVRMNDIPNSLKTNKIFVDLIEAKRAQTVTTWFENYYHNSLVSLSKAYPGSTITEADAALNKLPSDYTDKVADRVRVITTELSLNQAQ